jgi:hypothetical protein
MESLILSSKNLTNLDEQEIELKAKAKTLVYLDLSNNLLE